MHLSWHPLLQRPVRILRLIRSPVLSVALQSRSVQPKGTTINTIHILVQTQNLIADTAVALNERFQRDHSERGEGVISAAIAVLIMATIGALMYLSYVNLFKSSATKTGKLVDLSTFAPVSY